MSDTEVRIIEELKGKTFDSVTHDKEREEIIFQNENETVIMLHYQDCCEDVHVEEIHGDLEVLENFPLVEAEEVTQDDLSVGVESGTWTFYKLGTIIGNVTIRWYGSSNGYYSERVSVVNRVG